MAISFGFGYNRSHRSCFREAFLGHPEDLWRHKKGNKSSLFTVRPSSPSAERPRGEGIKTAVMHKHCLGDYTVPALRACFFSNQSFPSMYIRIYEHCFYGAISPPPPGRLLQHLPLYGTIGRNRDETPSYPHLYNLFRLQSDRKSTTSHPTRILLA